MPDLAQVTEHIRGAVGDNSGLGKTVKLDLGDEGKIFIDGASVPNIVTNEDKPGHIGRLGTLLGTLGINIANFNLGRAEVGGDAIALLSIDGQLTDEQLGEIAAAGTAS